MISKPRERRGRLGLMAAAVLLAWPLPAAAEWGVEAYGSLSGPVSPDLFTEGWGSGLGIGGGLSYGMGIIDVVLEGEFTQFSFDGIEGLGDMGGERRFSRLALLFRLNPWERDSEKRERLSLLASAGWGHQSMAGTFGEGATTPDGEILGDGTEDGWALTAGLEFSRSLFRTTRWCVGLRYSHYDFSTESPAYTSLFLGLRMPLSGSR
jgi:hypothetical protein